MTRYQKTELLWKNLNASGVSVGSAEASSSLYNEAKSVVFGSISTEDFDEVFKEKSATATDIISKVKDAMNSVDMELMGKYSSESFDGTPTHASTYTDAQIKAGVTTALFAQSARNTIEQLRQPHSFSPTSTDSKNPVNAVNGLVLAPSEMFSGISTEAFDGTSNFSSVYYNIAVNVEAARSDDFSEMNFPTLVISPEEVGLAIPITFTSFVSDYVRGITGEPVVYQPKSLIKHAYDNDVLLKDKTKIIPKLISTDPKNKASFLEEAKIKIQLDEGEFETAPLLVNQERDIIGLGFANSLTVGQGVADRTDALYPSIRVMDIYFKVQTQNSKENIIKIPIGGIQGTSFLWVVESHFKSLALNLNNSEVNLKIGNGLPTGLNGQTQDFTNDLDAYKDYTIVIGFGINGNASMDKGTVVVNANQSNIKRAYNAQGQEISAQDLQTLQQAFKKLDLVAYDLEAFRTNTNLRTKGQLLQIDTYTKYFSVPYGSGFSIVGPTVQYTGTANDINHVVNTADACNLKSNAQAVETLIRTGEELKVLASAKSETRTRFVSDDLVNPYYHEEVLDVRHCLDSLSSTNRMEDLRSALRNYLASKAMDMYRAGYINAFKLQGNVGKKAIVLVSTDINIASYLLYGSESNVFDLNDELRCVVVSTPNRKMDDTLFMSFSMSEKVGEITTINPLHFGFRAFSPLITLDYQRQNGSITKEITTVPRYLHIPVLPVLTKITVTNLTSGLTGKVAIDVNKKVAVIP